MEETQEALRSIRRLWTSSKVCRSSNEVDCGRDGSDGIDIISESSRSINTSDRIKGYVFVGDASETGFRSSTWVQGEEVDLESQLIIR